MELSLIIMWAGFAMAAYSVVGNDMIQTLGTFLTSNEKRPWWVLWLFAGGILATVLTLGWIDGDIAYGRLDKIYSDKAGNPITIGLEWYHLLPPLTLLFITRFGIPVSTTFLILTLFSLSKFEGTGMDLLYGMADPSGVLGKMIMKSLLGYVVAFAAGGFIYLLVTRLLEKKFLEKPLDQPDNSIWTNKSFWTAAQWLSTGFLWWQWLTQDLANIYVYLLGDGNIDAGSFAISLAIILGLLAYIFYTKGGAIQDIVKAKTNTADIRSATFVDLIYGIILFIFKNMSNIPMSTTWVFIGLLAGREIAIRFRLEGKVSKKIRQMVGMDLFKVFAGLAVSVILVFIIKSLS